MPCLLRRIERAAVRDASIVVLPLPMRLSSIDEFVSQTRQRMRDADARLLVADPELAAFVAPEAGDPPLLRIDELAAGAAAAWVRPADDPQRLAILQFTSGSTSDPKGVMLPDRVLCANLDAVAEAATLDPDDDVLVSWLPLYHDMGLVGLLTLPMSTGTALVLGAPQDFTARPARWMEWMSTYGGTATAGPDFGMAEVAIGGTFPAPLSGMTTDCVDRRVLETERYAAPVEPGTEGSRRLPLLGRPVPGLEIRIVDPDTGAPLREREVGQLVMRGRIKDVIIVGGRNLFPEDVERSVGQLEGVRAGNVIALGVAGDRGRESLVVVAESKTADDDLAALRRLVHERVLDVAGVPPKDIVLVAPGTLPKTSSGKLQRSLCKRHYLAGRLELINTAA